MSLGALFAWCLIENIIMFQQPATALGPVFWPRLVEPFRFPSRQIGQYGSNPLGLQIELMLRELHIPHRCLLYCRALFNSTNPLCEAMQKFPEFGSCIIGLMLRSC